jgi:hypothetical protein
MYINETPRSSYCYLLPSLSCFPYLHTHSFTPGINSLQLFIPTLHISLAFTLIMIPTLHISLAFTLIMNVVNCYLVNNLLVVYIFWCLKETIILRNMHYYSDGYSYNIAVGSIQWHPTWSFALQQFVCQFLYQLWS